MAGFSIKGVRGMAPRVPERALDQNASVLLLDAEPHPVELRPLPAPLVVAAGALTKAGTMRTLYRFGYDAPSEAGAWFHWPERVHVMRGAVAGDTEERTYFTGLDFPRMTYASAALNGGGTDYPIVSYRLGVPRADSALSAVVQNRVLTGLTFGDGVVTAVCDQPHRLASGDVVTIEGTIPAEFEAAGVTITVIDDVTFTYTPDGSPTVSPATAAGGYNLGGLLERRAYAVSYITDKDERGAPGGVVLVSCYAGQVVQLTLPTPPTGPYNIDRAIIWRTADASDETVYREVAIVPAASGSFTDDYLFDELGDVIDCRDNLMPPDNLRCLTGGPNGMAAGIAGNDVCFALGYKPHAWPVGGRYTLKEKPVGLAAFGQSWLVMTQGSPRVFSGIDPYSMSEEELTGLPSCLSEASIVPMAGGVVWACESGLAYFGPDGFKLLTIEQFTDVEWAAYAPASIIGGQWLGRYVGFYDTGAKRGGFIYDPATNDFRETSVTADAVFYDPALRQLYLAQGDDVLRFAGDTAKALPYLRLSPPLVTPAAVCPAWAKVVGSTYPIQFAMQADGQQVCSVVAADDKPFRLPGGYRAKTFRFTIAGWGHFQSAYLAQTVSDLQQVVE